MTTYVFMLKLLRESQSYESPVMRVGTNNLHQYFVIRQDNPYSFSPTSTSYKHYYDGRKFYTAQRSSTDGWEWFGPYFPSFTTGEWHQIGYIYYIYLL